MPKQSPTQREDRERNLLDAAYRLFISKGQLKTSVDDIVQEAQVAKGSFYTYFHSKEELTQKLIERLCTRILHECYNDCRRQKVPDFTERVVLLVDSLLNHFKRNKLQLYLIQRNFNWSMVEQELRCPTDHVWRELAESVSQSPLAQQKTPEEITRMIFVLLEMCSATCYSSIIENRPAPIDQMKPILYEVLRKTLAES